MRTTRIFTGIIAAALACAGCSASGDSSDDAGQNAKPLPHAIDGPQPDVFPQGGDELRVKPAPKAGDSVEEKIQHALRENVLSIAHTPGETSAKCPDGITMKASVTSSCTVTYEGAEIPYEVKISDSYREGSMVFSYEKTPKSALLVAKEIYNLMWEHYGKDSGRSDASKLACDELPAAKAVKFGADTGYACQYWGEHGTADGEPGYVTVDIIMGDTPGAIALQEVR
ncbi:hypothetical protein [Streptomyces abyssomicinicus]|uniref:hypothetical protein n=1 Tax=Streptomyces abyssomicinicus TaxID=574929 RepID=UPI00124FA5E2|nr:hypothetical protein [Streptomyces abyssomicinicus]